MRVNHGGQGQDSPKKAVKTCPLCHKSLRDHQANVQVSIDVVVDESKTSREPVYYKCCACSAHRLRSAKLFFGHVQAHVCKPYTCPQCFRGYSSQELRDTHVQVVHLAPETGVKFACELCPFVANYRSTLKSHVIAKHHPEPQPPPPAVIEKASKPALVSRMVCPNCHREFSWSFYQKKHRKQCIGGIGVVPAVNFASQGQGQGSKPRVSACFTCKQTFASKLGESTKNEGYSKCFIFEGAKTDYIPSLLSR